MKFNTKKITGSLAAAFALTGSVYATDFSKTSYYVAYDSADARQYALVMPAVGKVYTHVAGDITNLTQIDAQFASAPTFEDGEVCFSGLTSTATGEGGASIMANQCYDVNYFYVQKDGTSFMLYNKGKDKLQEGTAGDATSFLTVKEGDVIYNENSASSTDYSEFGFDVVTGVASIESNAAKEQVTLPNSISSDMTLDKTKLYIMDGLTVVENGATLTIPAGTTIAAKPGTGDLTSYMIVDKGSKIMAVGTASEPIIFTSTKAVIDGEAPAVGQWGGLVLIGNAGNPQVGPYECNEAFVPGTSNLADNSGTLQYVKVLNSGITMATDKEINGLSMVGVGSGTTVDHIRVDKSDDDCIELWGGTVNVANATLTECTDDHFDIDDGYAGTVSNLKVYQTTGNALIEQSGETAATFDGFTLIQNQSAGEGGIYFKKDAIGGHFKNGVVIDNVTDGKGAIYSKSADGVSDTIDAANTSFENVVLSGSSIDSKITGTSAATLTNIYQQGRTATLSNTITANKTLTADKTWIIDGLTVVENGATLTIEPGTTVVGKAGTGDLTSYMIVDKGSKIMAMGTSDKPVLFTSADVALDAQPAAVGQWGGLVLIGNAGNPQVGPYECNEAFVPGTSNLADNSGTLRYVNLLNSGITMATDKEINGLSMVGVGSGTTVDHIRVDKSDDDCVELWGGTVNLSNVYLTECTDDHFDIDDGYAGTVTNLKVVQTTGNALIEQSGETHATFKNFSLTQNYSNGEGGIYFKKDAIGGHFIDGVIIDNVTDGFGAIYSKSADGVSDTIDAANTSFTGVTLEGSSADPRFTGTSATTLESIFNSGTNNTIN